ncbi:galactitol-1-phosphate 5-dehydrogenase [Paenibacillaceae bacterium]|nr:galactitol-1-phosphate 5-dehydrogenase [Paenibacillaceae bacterium]
MVCSLQPQTKAQMANKERITAMETIVYYGPEQLGLENREIPVPGPHEVLIRVEAVGICGSELEGYLGHSSVRIPPLVMGHEFCGIIAALGAGAAPAHTGIGDKVVVNPLIACGQCDRCIAGNPNICRSRQIVGIHRPGAFADYAVVPARSVHVIAQHVDSALASLAEPLAVCIHALRLGCQSFDDLIIFGAGPIGLLTLQAALLMGAGRVLVVDRQETRLAYAAELGGIAVPPGQLMETCHRVFGEQGVDTVIDCVGVQATRAQSLQLVNAGGRIIMVGLGSNDTQLPMNELVRKEVAIIGSYTYSDADFKHAVQLLVSGKIKMTNWATRQPLSAAPEAFRQLTAGTSAWSKIILEPGTVSERIS